MCVVGGGYMGLWTALALREREPSLSVVVLEAEAGQDGRRAPLPARLGATLPRLFRMEIGTR